MQTDPMPTNLNWVKIGEKWHHDVVSRAADTRQKRTTLKKTTNIYNKRV